MPSAKDALGNAMSGRPTGNTPVSSEGSALSAAQAAMRRPPKEVFNAQEDRRQDRDQMLENAARLAQSRLTAKTTGAGFIVEKTPQYFNCSFVEEPSFTSGAVLNAPPNASYAYPICNAGVYKWERNDKDHYIGAYMYYVVTINALDADEIPAKAPSATITHHLLFQGIAIKDLPENVMVGLESAEAKLPNFFSR